jgi:Protein of unknown function (DUF2489)
MKSTDADTWRSLVVVLDALLSEKIGITEGCRRVVRLRFELSEERSKLFLPFVGVDSETDAFPLGEVRELWSAALVREDKKRSRVEDHYRPFVIKASKELIAYAGSRIRDA